MRTYKEFSLPPVPYIDPMLRPDGFEWEVLDKMVKFLKKHAMMDAIMMAIAVVVAPLHAPPDNELVGFFCCGLCMKPVYMPHQLSEHTRQCRLRSDQQLGDWTVQRSYGR